MLTRPLTDETSPMLTDGDSSSHRESWKWRLFGLVCTLMLVGLIVGPPDHPSESEQIEEALASFVAEEGDPSTYFYAFHGTSKEAVQGIVANPASFRPSADGKLGPGVYLTFMPKKAKKYSQKARTWNSWVRYTVGLSDHTHILVVEFAQDPIFADDLSAGPGEKAPPSPIQCGMHGTTHHKDSRLAAYKTRIYYPICPTYTGPYQPHKDDMDFSEFIIDASLIHNVAELPLSPSESSNSFARLVATTQQTFCKSAGLPGALCEAIGDFTEGSPADDKDELVENIEDWLNTKASSGLAMPPPTWYASKAIKKMDPSLKENEPPQALPPRTNVH